MGNWDSNGNDSMFPSVLLVARRDAGEDESASEGAPPGGRSLKRLKAPSAIKQSTRSWLWFSVS